MLKAVLSVILALSVGLCAASAQEAEKKPCPKKPAVAKKAQPKKALTEAEKAERAKKREAALEKMFKAKDKDGDGKLSFDEFKGKAEKPEAIERMEKAIKAKDKDGDGALTLEELKA